PPGAVRRQACATQDPKVSSPSSPRSAWLAFIHTPAGVTDAISANPLFAIDPSRPVSRTPPPVPRAEAYCAFPLAQLTHTDALSDTCGRLLAPAAQSSVQCNALRSPDYA